MKNQYCFLTELKQPEGKLAEESTDLNNTDHIEMDTLSNPLEDRSTRPTDQMEMNSLCNPVDESDTLSYSVEESDSVDVKSEPVDCNMSVNELSLGMEGMLHVYSCFCQ